MSKNPRLKGNEKPSQKKIDTAIIVALIGLCGTLLAAILAGPLLPSLMPKPNPSIIAPTETATLFQPVEQDWKSIIRLSIPNNHCRDRVFPATINPEEDIVAAGLQLSQAIHTNEDLNWLPLATWGNDQFDVNVSSIVTDIEWIKISNEILVDVTVQKDLPEHLNVASYGDCGQGGKVRIFPQLNISNDFDEYTIKPVYSEEDYFKLEPGEFEIFRILFECKGVGIYQLKVNVSYEYKGSSGITAAENSIHFVCPQTYTLWLFDEGSDQFLSSTTYRWNGNGYEEMP